MDGYDGELGMAAVELVLAVTELPSTKAATNKTR
jgi:hypothetical protein